jgi:hypothetical protein
MTMGAELYWPSLAKLILKLAAKSPTDPWLIALQREAGNATVDLLQELDK